MKLLKWIDVDIIGSSLLPKIGLAGLAAKKIPPVAKKKSLDNDQKRILLGLSLKGGEKKKDDPLASYDLRQTILRAEEANAKGAGSDVERSSKLPLRDDDDLEVLEEKGLSQRIRRPHTTSSKSLQNMATDGDGVPVILEEEGVAEPEGGYDHLVLIKKIFQKRPFQLTSNALDLLPTYL
ncbi:hypothetical protein Fot_22298 [Forsythia ovata]|uniref:Uncharacterized protein n=1 Tax=Forsythia ovata TaxID=205694 RepID=A0ABD1UXB9_9LAMI